MDWIYLALEGSCEHGNELSGSVKCCKILEQLRTQLQVVTLCSSERARRFRGIFRLYFRGRRVSYAQLSAFFSYLLAWFNLDSEDRSNMFLRNVGLSPKHKTLQPKRFKFFINQEFKQYFTNTFQIITGILFRE
jgi:hypothetical protein